MNCREVQELLKTDYADNESEPRVKEQIINHLAGCAECRQMEKDLQTAHNLFQEVPRMEPPQRIWQHIRSDILEERQEQEYSRVPGFLERLRLLFPQPRPAFALAGIFSFVIIAAVFVGVIVRNGSFLARSAGSEMFADYRLNGENSEQFSSLGTNIEEYFL